MIGCLILLGLLIAPHLATAARPRVTLLVSAASDLTLALQELGARFEQSTGIKVLFNFGATGQLAQQIERGAPVDVFLAANVGFIEALEAQGLILADTTRAYARGHLTLWTRGDSPLHFTRIEDVARPEVRRIAIANPCHAPYGVAARQALQAAGLWEPLQPRLVLGENVRQTLQYAVTGNVDVALVALSLSMQHAGRWVRLPEDLHGPIIQALAVIKGTRHAAPARQFAAFITGPQGRPILQRYGFTLPAESDDQ